MPHPEGVGIPHSGDAPVRGLSKLLEIATVAQERDPLRRQALPVMEQLHRELRETINLGVFEESQIVYAEVLESPQQLRLVPRIGAQACLHATAPTSPARPRVPACA